jgi:hypothetical protein
MVENHFPPERIAEVRGFADRQLRHPDQPELPANRRISLIVMYGDRETEEEPSETAAAEASTTTPDAALSHAEVAP